MPLPIGAVMVFGRAAQLRVITLPVISRFFRRRLVRRLLLVLAAGAVTYAIVRLPETVISARHMVLTPKERLDAESAFRGSVLQLLGGIVVIGGLYFTARGFQITAQG